MENILPEQWKSARIRAVKWKVLRMINTVSSFICWELQRQKCFCNFLRGGAAERCLCKGFCSIFIDCYCLYWNCSAGFYFVQLGLRNGWLYQHDGDSTWREDVAGCISSEFPSILS